MSADGKLGQRKLRQAQTEIGRPLLMAFAYHPWITGVTLDDEHWLWNRKTGEVIRDHDPVHWTTCPMTSGVEHLPANERRAARLAEARRALLRPEARCGTVECPNAWTHLVTTEMAGSLVTGRYCTPCTVLITADDDEHTRTVTPPLSEEH